jgi:hypothetical protein
LAQLIGTSAASAANNAPTGYRLYQRFTASGSGNVDTIKVYCLANSNVRVALYTDSGTNPATLLNQSVSVAITATGYKDIPIPSTALVSGTVYHIGEQVETAGGGSYRTGVSPARYTYVAGAYGAFPSTESVTGGSDNDIEYALQGWEASVTARQSRALLGVGS